MAPAPLPPLPGGFGQPAGLAYARILPLEEHKPIMIRILGWMLIHAPSAQGRAYMAESINRCATDEDVIKLGEANLNHFVNYCQSQFHTRAVVSSFSAVRRHCRLDNFREGILNNQAEAPTDYSNAKKQSPHLQAQIESLPPPGPKLRYTECCYILPQYIGHRLADMNRVATSAGIQSVVEMFGGIPFEDWNGPRVHNLRNLMTLCEGIHTAFDRLAVWLEPVEGSENQHFIRRLPRMYA